MAERTSLIPETLRQLETEGVPAPLLDQRAAKKAAAEERRARQRSLQACNLPDFAQRLQAGCCSTRAPTYPEQLR